MMLEGERIYLRKTNSKDLKIIKQWLQKPEIRIPYGFGEGLEKSFICSENNHAFMIVTKKPRRIIGACHVNYILDRGDIGIIIGDKSWHGKGYGTEALKLLLDCGFNTLGYNFIGLQVFGFNIPAIRCYEKVGFKEITRLKDSVIYENKLYDWIFIGLSKKEYLKQNILGR